MPDHTRPPVRKDLSHYLGVVGRIIGRSLDADAADAVVQKLDAFEQLTPLVESLSDGHAYGFYDGLIAGLSDSPQYELRFHNGQAGKVALAEYCLKTPVLGSCLRRFSAEIRNPTGWDPRPRSRLFFESGTTISYVVGRLAKALQEAQTGRSGGLQAMPATVITNNLICITALAKYVESVIPTHGRLEYKYFGFLACEDTVPKDREGLFIEQASYSALAESIKGCSSVFATCSRFSFLLGPLVGSRPNCLTKCAMYQGAGSWQINTGKEFFLCLHFSKIIPLVRRSEPTQGPEPHLAFEATDEYCRHVFPPLRFKTDSAGHWERNLTDFIHRAARGFRLEPAWHFRALGNQDLAKIPIDQVNHRCEDDHVPKYGRLQSWPQWLEANRTLNLLIALPEAGRELAVQHLRMEVELANHVFETMRLNVRYDSGELAQAPATGVAAVSVRPT